MADPSSSGGMSAGQLMASQLASIRHNQNNDDGGGGGGAAGGGAIFKLPTSPEEILQLMMNSGFARLIGIFTLDGALKEFGSGVQAISSYFVGNFPSPPGLPSLNTLFGGKGGPGPSH